MKDDYFNFIIVIIKCFFILLVFGLYLPQILDWILFLFITEKYQHFNSIFVCSEVYKNFKIIYKYKSTYNEFLGL